MKFIRFWIIAVFMAGHAEVQGAGCRAVRVVQQKVVVVEKVVAAVVAPVVAAYVPVAVPIYNTQFYPPTAPYAAPPAYQGGGYNGAAQAQHGDCEQKLAGTFRQFGDLLKQLDSRLQRLEGGPGTVPPQVPPAGPQPPRMPPADGGKPLDPFAPAPEPQTAAGAERLLALSVRHCGQCHDSSRSAVSGGKFTLLEGGKFSANLSPESVGLIVSAVSSKTMPKTGTMSPEERLEFLALLVGGK